MGPLPKRKYPKAAQGARRSHLGITPTGTDICPQCHSTKLPHTVCPTCGMYNGRQVLEIKTPKSKTG